MVTASFVANSERFVYIYFFGTTPALSTFKVTLPSKVIYIFAERRLQLNSEC